MIAPHELRPLAESAALLGGKMARDAFGRRHAITIKPDSSEVTEVDVAVERAVVAHIRASRPDDAFIGEEDVAGQQSRIQNPTPARRDGRAESKIVWCIDPIDGTRNFIRGVPLFTCSVAALVEGTPAAGAIYDPMGDVLYSAARGAGATQRVGCVVPAMRNAPDRLDATGAFRKAGTHPTSASDAIRNPTPIIAIPSAWNSATGAFVRRICETSVVRSLGCATLHLVQVATGGVDGTFMNNCKLWDIAAGWLIAVESGALATRPDGSPLFPIVVDSDAGAEMPTLVATSTEHSRLTEMWRSL